MRVLFTTFPERTHLLAMTSLAWAMRTAGHDVRFAVQPKFAGVVTQAGLTAVPIGSDRDLWQILGRNPHWLEAGPNGLPVPYDTAESTAEEISWDYLQRGYRTQVDRWHALSNQPMIGELVEFARCWRPELVLWDPVTYAGSLAANACGAAHGRLLFSLDIFGVTRARYLRLAREQPAPARSDPLAEWLAPYARKYGFPFSEELISGQFTVELLPPSLRLRADLRYLPARYLPYGGPAVVPKWLWERPRRRRVALTLGLSPSDHDFGYAISVPDVLDALADLDVEVVATVADSQRHRLRAVPSNARIVPYVPLNALVPSCAAVIHHAGFGTLATTALHAVPQLTLSRDADGPALAKRVARQGAGIALDPAIATGEQVRTSVQRLLDEPGFAERAGALRDEMLTMAAPNNLVNQLVDLVEGGR